MLWLAKWPYHAAISARNFAYNTNALAAHPASVPVLSIGNLTTGGTGVTGRDITPEAVERVATKMIPGFGEYFRYISIASIGTSTVQSRACAVLARGTYIFALPGSNGAVKDGWDRILAHQLDSRHRPCNFVELMPRLRER